MSENWVTRHSNVVRFGRELCGYLYRLPGLAHTRNGTQYPAPFEGVRR